MGKTYFINNNQINSMRKVDEIEKVVQTAGRNVQGVDCSNEWCEAVSKEEYAGLR